MVLLGVFVPVWVFWPVAAPPLVISRETTFLTRPLNPDGTVNYVAAINEMLATGVTPENNAAGLVLAAIGPAMVDESVRATVLQELGVDDLPAQECFILLKDFVRATRPALVPQLEVVVNRVLTNWGTGLKPEDQSLAEAWLAANRRPLELLVEASRRPRFYVPLVDANNPPNMVSCKVPYIIYGDATKALAIRASQRLDDGDLEGAWNDAQAVRRLAALYSQQAMVIGDLVGVELDGTASQIAVRLAQDPQLKADQARRMLGELQSMPEQPSLERAVDVGERCSVLDSAMFIMRPSVNSSGGVSSLVRGSTTIDYNVVLRRINTEADLTVAPWRVPDYAERRRLQDEYSTRLARLRGDPGWVGAVWRLLRYLASSPQGRLRSRSELVADKFVAFAWPTLSSADDRRLAAAMRRRVAETVLALRVWREERGNYPSSLGDLVPAYLPQVPIDVFSGKPLVYRAANGGYLLYSVGINAKDDSGASSKAADADDILVRIP
jgi:hypothetical protein